MTGVDPVGAGRPTWIEVDLDILQANARLACEGPGPGRVLAVVTADRWGLGILDLAHPDAPQVLVPHGRRMRVTFE